MRDSGLSRWPSGTRPPASAKDVGSIPDLGCSTGRRAARPVPPNCWALEPMHANKRSHRNEKPAHCSEDWPLLTTARESLRKAAKSQCSQKNKRKKWETQVLGGARKWCEWAMTADAKHWEDVPGERPSHACSLERLCSNLLCFLFFFFLSLKTFTHQGQIQQSASWQPPNEWMNVEGFVKNLTQKTSLFNFFFSLLRNKWILSN